MMLIAKKPANAQTPCAETGERGAVSLEFFRPQFYNDGPIDRNGLAAFFSLCMNITNKVRLVGQLPVAFGNSEEEYYGYGGYLHSSHHSTAIGNIYLGLNTGKQPNGPFMELGIRFPTASKDENSYLAHITAWYADIDRFDAFSPNWTTLKASIGFRHRWGSGLGVRALIGPSYSAFTGIEAIDPITLLNYGAHLLYDRSTFFGELGLAGITNCNDELVLTSEQSALRLELGIGTRLRDFRPELYVARSLNDDLNSDVRFILGLNLRFLLN